jgi:hypothetical protein
VVYSIVHGAVAKVLLHQSSLTAQRALASQDEESAKLASEALLGLVKINLLDDPIPKLKFGQWNPRPIDKATQNNLVAEFTSGKCKPWTSPLILIAGKRELNKAQGFSTPGDWMDPTPALLAQLPPFLPLPNIQYRIAGGNHRVTSAKIAVDRLQQKSHDLEEKYRELGEKLKTLPAEDSRIEEYRTALEKIEGEMATAAEFVEQIKTWPMKVFDDGMILVLVLITR